MVLWSNEASRAILDISDSNSDKPWITHSVQQIFSSEANSSSASQEIRRILWNLQPATFILSWINPAQASPSRFMKDSILI